MTEFSIIVPIYNTEKYLVRCFDSILNQNSVKSHSFELILVNDGSTDNSLTIAERYAKNYSNIQVISQPNGGLSAARNRGLEAATGKYVWFIDSDDWISENSLNVLYDALNRFDPDVLQFRAINTTGTKFIQRGGEFRNPNAVVSGVEMFLSGEWPTCAPFYIFKREFLEHNHLKFYVGIFHEDNEFTPRMLLLAEKAIWINDILYFVYQTPNSITRSFNPKKSFDLIKVGSSLLSLRDEYELGEICNKKINSFICLSLNNALNGILAADKYTQKEFIKEFYHQDGLINCYRKSDSIQYKFEFLCIKTFGFLNAYRLIKGIRKILRR